MSTVTYVNQPAIHATRGAVPEEGTALPYKVAKLLWPKDVERKIDELCIGSTLHACCGKSLIGTVRLDLFQPGVDVKGDAARLPFASGCFETVVIDPPYNGKFQWNHDMLVELCRVASKRIIFQHWFIPADKYGRYKKNHKFQLNPEHLYNWMPKTYFGRVQVISVFDRVGDVE